MADTTPFSPGGLSKANGLSRPLSRRSKTLPSLPLPPSPPPPLAIRPIPTHGSPPFIRRRTNPRQVLQDVRLFRRRQPASEEEVEDSRRWWVWRGECVVCFWVVETGQQRRRRPQVLPPRRRSGSDGLDTRIRFPLPRLPRSPTLISRLPTPNRAKRRREDTPVARSSPNSSLFCSPLYCGVAKEHDDGEDSRAHF